MSQTNPWNDDPKFKAWEMHVRTSLIPMIDSSGMTLSLVPEDPTDVDVKFAVELGLSIVLGKPIILCVSPGTKLSDQLVRCADEIVEGEPGDEGFTDRLQAAITRVRESIEAREADSGS